ncbi:MAG: four helix bundle protein [Parcubacteria group bacterium]|nr:four helix bundle protein [Parcubacteria group bacterium]
MYYRFEKLEVWKLAREFTVAIYKVTSRFPKEEIFGLVSQIRRVSVSIVLNIAEGSDKKSDAEFKRFLRMSLGSIEEVISGLYIALDLDFINRKDFDSLYQMSGLVVSKLKGLINSLK